MENPQAWKPQGNDTVSEPAGSSDADPGDDRAEFLAKLRALDEEEAPAIAPPPLPLSTPKFAPAQADPQGNPSRDALLEQLAAIDRAPRIEPVNPLPPQPAVVRPPTPQSSSVQPPVQPPVQLPVQPPAQSAPPRATDYPIPNLIEQLSLYAKEKLETRAQQRLQKQQRAELEAKVQAWLEALDPLSDDGFWFEQFAQNYSSRREAAIAFLQPPTQP